MSDDDTVIISAAKAAPDKPSMAPSVNTVWTAVGGIVATTIVIILHACKVDIPAGYEAGLASAVTLLAGYLHSAGRA